MPINATTNLKPLASSRLRCVRNVHNDLEIIDTYHAAVLTRKPNGKVASVKRTEEPTRQTAAKGLNFGLVVGVVVALFPAAGIGLVAGMFRMVPPEPVSELSLATSLKAARSDLKNLGELLDNGTWARGRVPSTPRGRCPQPVQPVLVAAPSPGKGRHAKAGLETLNII